MILAKFKKMRIIKIIFQKIGREASSEELVPTRILSPEEKQKILKERRLAKRKAKEAAANSEQ